MNSILTKPLLPGANRKTLQRLIRAATLRLDRDHHRIFDERQIAHQRALRFLTEAVGRDAGRS
jgi:hypothetical protein